MELLLSNCELRSKMGDEGRRRIVENFGWDVIVEKFQQYIKEG